MTPPDGQDASRRSSSGLEIRLRSNLGIDRRGEISRSPKRTFGESDAEEGAEDGSLDGRRVRRRGVDSKPVSGSSIISSASPPSLVLPPPSSPDDLDEKDAEGEDEEDKSVMRLLDDDNESESSLSPVLPGPRQVETLKKRGNGLSLEGGSQDSLGTAPPSSASPSSRPSPAPESQETEDSQPRPQSYSSKPLTRRQRRTLGLPKHGNGSGRTGGANIILIPGGKHPSRLAMKANQARKELLVVQDGKEEEEEESLHEWERNGSGRKDSRGFVILNI